MKGIEMQPRHLSIITFLLATLSRESANYYSWSWSLVRANRLSNKQQRIEAKLFHRNTMSQQVFVTHVAHPYLSAVYRSVRTCVTVPRVDNKLPVVPNILTWRHLSKAHKRTCVNKRDEVARMWTEKILPGTSSKIQLPSSSSLMPWWHAHPSWERLFNCVCFEVIPIVNLEISVNLSAFCLNNSLCARNEELLGLVLIDIRTVDNEA